MNILPHFRKEKWVDGRKKEAPTNVKTECQNATIQNGLKLSLAPLN